MDEIFILFPDNRESLLKSLKLPSIIEIFGCLFYFFFYFLGTYKSALAGYISILSMLSFIYPEIIPLEAKELSEFYFYEWLAVIFVTLIVSSYF